MRDRPKERPSKPQFGLVHAFYANMGGFAFYGSYDEEELTAKETPFESATNPRHTVDVPKFETLIYIMTHFPDIMTNTPEEIILDRAKSSSLAKFILIVQVTRFCISCLSRLARHLPLTLIEVSTAAHAFCTILTYIVWWSKPMNVAVPTILREREAEEVYALLKCSDSDYDSASALAMAGKVGTGGSGGSRGTQAPENIALAANALRRLETPQRPPSGTRFRNKDDSMLVPGNFSNKSPNKDILVPLVAAISPIAFGPIHFLAWNDNFPTPMEQLLWYVSSGVVTFSGLMGVCLLLFFMMLHHISNNRGLDVLANVMTVAVIPAIHMLASGFLIVESFRQLAYLDPPSFQLALWSNYWPRL